MSQSRRLSRGIAIFAFVFMAAISVEVVADSPGRNEIRVCADSNNLPFSNDKFEGFENKIAELVARELNVSVRYRWNVSWSSSSLRALRKGECDLLMGVPTGLDGIALTRPYFVSTYVFVTAKRRNLQIDNFDDPSLSTLKIGLHVIGRGGANTPVANALAVRKMNANITGYPMWGTSDGGEPQGQIIAAVASGDIDTAVVWGPIAGYFAKPYGDQLVVTPVASDARTASTPFVFEIALGVREGDVMFKSELEAVLDRRVDDIRQILNEFGIPLVRVAPQAAVRTKQ